MFCHIKSMDFFYSKSIVNSKSYKCIVVHVECTAKNVALVMVTQSEPHLDLNYGIIRFTAAKKRKKIRKKIKAYTPNTT